MTEQNNLNTENNVNNANNTVVNEELPTFEAADIQKNKTMAGLSYLIFFLPLIACPESKFARFHANQSLLLLILAFAGNIVLGMIPIIGWLLMPIFAILVMVFGIMGLINGLNGKVKRLPIIGKFTLLK
ncbi:MAG: DUF4870 domain-containing protein [Clostridia bacterium]